MRLPALAVLAVAVLAASGCGGGDEGREERAAYLEAVNRTQADFEVALRQSQQAVRAFAAGRTTAQTGDRLRQAVSVMRATRASLAEIEPPQPAQALHADVMRLLDLQAELALELGLAADYARTVAAAVGPAQQAARTLGRRLRAAATGDDQARELRAYARRVGTSIDRLDALAPPPFLLPWHDDQRRRLRDSRRDALALASGIRDRDREAVERALEAFTARPAEDVLRAAQTAAVERFNGRLDEQERVLTRIAREQALFRLG